MFIFPLKNYSFKMSSALVNLENELRGFFKVVEERIKENKSLNSFEITIPYSELSYVTYLPSLFKNDKFLVAPLHEAYEVKYDSNISFLENYITLLKESLSILYENKCFLWKETKRGFVMVEEPDFDHCLVFGHILWEIEKIVGEEFKSDDYMETLITDKEKLDILCKYLPIVVKTK